LTVRAWLEPAPSSNSLPERRRYRLTEDGIDLFFHDCPLLILEVQGAAIPVEEIQSQLEQMRLVAGNEDDLEGRVEFQLSDLIRAGSPGPLRIDLSGVLPPALVEPGLDVRWLHLDDSSTSGQDLRFVLHPYTNEALEPSGPTNSGRVSLEDPSGVWEALDLRPASDPRLPVAGQMNRASVPVSSEVAFLDYQVRGIVDLPLYGIWFQTDRWTLKDFKAFLEDRKLDCGLAIVPANESLLFQVETDEGSALATKQLAGPCSRAVNFAEIFPEELLNNADLNAHWLACPRSFLVCRKGAIERGRIAIDLRGVVTSLAELSREGPDPMGSSRIKLDISYRQGAVAQDDMELLLLRTDRDPVTEVMTQPVTFRGALFVENHLQKEVTLPDPGVYQVILRRPGEKHAVASRDLQVCAPDIVPGLSLDEFLDKFPETPTLDQVIRLLRFLQVNRHTLQGEYAPWNLYRFYAHMDESWNRTTGTAQELLGVLRGYADVAGGGSFINITPVTPGSVPSEVFLESATVILHLQLNTPAHARPGLPEWEHCLDVVRQKNNLLPPDARLWAGVLHRACQRLQGQIVLPLPLAADQVTASTPWFPCQDPFLRFLSQ
jgi:hypothetical protein